MAPRTRRKNPFLDHPPNCSSSEDELPSTSTKHLAEEEDIGEEDSSTEEAEDHYEVQFRHSQPASQNPKAVIASAESGGSESDSDPEPETAMKAQPQAQSPTQAKSTTTGTKRALGSNNNNTAKDLKRSKMKETVSACGGSGEENHDMQDVVRVTTGEDPKKNTPRVKKDVKGKNVKKDPKSDVNVKHTGSSENVKSVVDDTYVLNEICRFGNVMGLCALNVEALKMGLESIEGSKRAEMQEKWRKLQFEELQLFLDKTQFVQDKVNLMIEALERLKQ